MFSPLVSHGNDDGTKEITLNVSQYNRVQFQCYLQSQCNNNLFIKANTTNLITKTRIISTMERNLEPKKRESTNFKKQAPLFPWHMARTSSDEGTSEAICKACSYFNNASSYCPTPNNLFPLISHRSLDSKFSTLKQNQ